LVRFVRKTVPIPQRHPKWGNARAAVIAAGAHPSHAVQTATARAVLLRV
jgi:hypothetical protein